MRTKIGKGITESGKEVYINIKAFCPSDIESFYKSLQVEEARCFIVEKNLNKSEDEFHDYNIIAEFDYQRVSNLSIRELMAFVYEGRLAFNYFYF